MPGLGSWCGNFFRGDRGSASLSPARGDPGVPGEQVRESADAEHQCAWTFSLPRVDTFPKSKFS